MKRFLIIVAFTLISLCSHAQRFTASTNILDWANFGTINAELGYSVSQHISLVAGGKYNGWDFSKGDRVRYSKKAVGYAGFRYWPWYVNSGMWFQFKGQFADYQISDIWRPALDEGRALGAGLSFGYTFMINERLNFELGAGGWGGYLLKHDLYECAGCMELRDDSGPRAFVDIDNFTAALVFVF